MDPEDILDVRLLIADTDPDNEVFTDEDIERFYALEGSKRRAAARALETHAASIAQLAGPIRGLLDIRVGGEQSAQVLLNVARSLRTGSGIMRSMALSNFPPGEQAF